MSTFTSPRQTGGAMPCDGRAYPRPNQQGQQDDSTATTASRSQKQLSARSKERLTLVAKYDFRGESGGDQLTFFAGEQIHVRADDWRKHSQSPVSWMAGVHHGRRGWFPPSYVETYERYLRTNASGVIPDPPRMLPPPAPEDSPSYSVDSRKSTVNASDVTLATMASHESQRVGEQRESLQLRQEGRDGSSVVRERSPAGPPSWYGASDHGFSSRVLMGGGAANGPTGGMLVGSRPWQADPATEAAKDSLYRNGWTGTPTDTNARTERPLPHDAGENGKGTRRSPRIGKQLKRWIGKKHGGKSRRKTLPNKTDPPEQRLPSPPQPEDEEHADIVVIVPEDDDHYRTNTKRRFRLGRWRR